MRLIFQERRSLVRRSAIWRTFWNRRLRFETEPFRLFHYLRCLDGLLHRRLATVRYYVCNALHNTSLPHLQSVGFPRPVFQFVPIAGTKACQPIDESLLFLADGRKASRWFYPSRWDFDIVQLGTPVSRKRNFMFSQGVPARLFLSPFRYIRPSRRG